MGENAHIAQPTLSMRVMRYLNQFRLSLHKIIIMTTSLHMLSMTHLTFPMENLGHAVSKPQRQKNNSHRTRKSTHLPCESDIMTT